MTQSETLLSALRAGPKTLNEILELPRCAAEYRRCFSDLRDMGYDITHHRVKNCKGMMCHYEPIPLMTPGISIVTEQTMALVAASCPAKVRGKDVYSLDSEPAMPKKLVRQRRRAPSAPPVDLFAG